MITKFGLVEVGLVWWVRLVVSEADVMGARG